ncbi:COG4223 family protein [Gymnodinialimonas ulvae]|uniref:COG4223 family protein n=1 Tax=Gymnodinialimonas ulvae TaxID=3126504 RepID=UPI00309A8F45
MAKQPSSGSGSRTKSETDAGDSVAPDVTEDALGGDTVLLGDDTLGEDAVAAEPDPGGRVTIEPGETTAAESAGDDSVQTEIVEEAAPADAPVERIVERTGPGFGPLLIGGVVAAALGYGAAFMGLRPTDTAAEDPALTAALEQIEAQQGTISDLQEQVATLANAEPPAAPEVDLSGVESAIAGVSDDVAGVGSAVEALTGRVVALEDRPIFTGEVAEDSAAMAEAVEALETRLTEERAAAAEAVAEAEAVQAAAAAELQAASDAAQAAIAEAQAEAQATAAATQAQAALSRIQIAMAAGDPFADALGTLPVDAPDALQAVAETGVPTLEDLQASYPAAARAALAEANRETAGDNVMGGLGAFLQNQIGGRSVVPRDGNDPDAVLSRVGAAVEAGDLSTALTEIAALPEGAKALLADWVGQVQTRADADAALAELAATLDN